MLSTERGTRNAERGTEAHPAVPRSDFRVPRWLVGALLLPPLTLLPPPAGAQQPDSALRDTTSLPPVVVTGVRLPTVRELARGLAGRTATRTVQALDARGVRPPAAALQQLPGVPASDELGAAARHGVWDYYVGARYEHETGWRQDTRSRIATLFAKVGLLNGTWDATLSYSGADNRIYQAGSLPESLATVRPDSNFTSGDYFAPRSHLVILNGQRLIGTTQLAINAFGRSLASEQFNVNFVGDDSRQRNRTRAGAAAAQLSGKVRLGGGRPRLLPGAGAGVQAGALRHLPPPPRGGPPPPH